MTTPEIDSSYVLPTILSVLSVAISLVASGHVVLYKRDTRAAIGWIGLIWLSPFLGTILYVLLGINRIRRRVRLHRRSRPVAVVMPGDACPHEALAQALGPEGIHLYPLVELVGRVTRQPLLGGNEVVPLVDGDQAYPAMIRAIEDATRSVALSTYIFNDDRVGRLFVEALARAQRRGVEARVLVDDIGVRYDWPTVIRLLRREKIPVARFLPTLAPGFMPYLNLRNHRKILVVDGRVGFTGGLNIDGLFIHDRRTDTPPRHDLHFRVRGPAVAVLARVFAEDWHFATGERLGGDAWSAAPEPAGPVLARGVVDGPDNDADTLLMTIHGALSCARSSVAILTPYFLPDAALIAALNVAALRGVAVDILLPRQNNLNLVKWASTPLLREVMEGGCRVWYAPPPFDHSKLMVVDRLWAFLGSANWDPRSFRLNFEFNLECYGHALADPLDRLIRERIGRAHPLTRDEIDGRPLPIRLRDGVARLLSPYL